jgi:hypothetical protein
MYEVQTALPYPPGRKQMTIIRGRARTRGTCAKNRFWSYEIDSSEACAREMSASIGL